MGYIGLSYLVPAEFTSGRATQVKPPLQGVRTNFPLTHCANLPSTHAFSPDEHEEDGLKLWNLAFNFCAASPFDLVKEARLQTVC